MEQFKVGDWVIEIHSKEIHQIIELFPDICRVRKPISEITYSTEYTDFILWQPKEGEWCWFYDDTEGTPIFGRFYKQDKDFGNCCYPQHQINSQYSYCEPFIGELPTFLQH